MVVIVDIVVYDTLQVYKSIVDDYWCFFFNNNDDWVLNGCSELQKTTA